MEVKRKKYLDQLRGLAAIGVIIIHISANNWYGYIGTTDWFVFTIYEGLCKVAVPIFFMISGCLFLDKAKNKPITSLYTITIKRLLIFLVFWSLVYKIFQWTGEGTFYEIGITFLKEIFMGNTQVHLWYVYAIIGLYIISPMLKVFANHATKQQLLYAIGCCFVLGSVHELSQTITAFTWLANNFTKMKCGIGFGYIGYFLLGYYLDAYEWKEKSRKLLYVSGIAGWCMTIGLVIRDCILWQTPMERFWGYTMPWVAVSAMAVFVFAKYQTIPIKGVESFLQKTADKSLGIYGCHFIYIIWLWRVGITTFSFAGMLSVPVLSLFVLICSYITSAVLQKIPYIGKYLA